MTTKSDIKVTKPKTKRNRKSHLSDTDRKLHHIQSEHKRRTAIREAFLKLTQLIPSLKEEDSRSEITVLDKSVDWLWKLQREYRELKIKFESQGKTMKEEWTNVIVPEFEETDIQRNQDLEERDNNEFNGQYSDEEESTVGSSSISMSRNSSLD